MLGCLNKQLLPIKIHFFLYFGGLAGMLPFLPLFARQLGISATVTGVIYTILPFLSLCAKPLFGSLADGLQKTKLLLLVFLVAIIFSFMAMLLIPSNKTGELEPPPSSECFFPFQNSVPLDPNITIFCLQDIQNETVNCTMTHNCQTCNAGQDAGKLNSTFLVIQNNIATCFEENGINITFHRLDSQSDSIFYFSIPLQGYITEPLHCLTKDMQNCTQGCDRSLLPRQCITKSKDSEPDTIFSYAFITFFCLIVIAWISTEVTISLSDAVCYEMLNGHINKYGEQRIWGTIGWGAVASLAGYFIDMASGSQLERDYRPGFCILGILISLDCFCIFLTNIKSTKSSANISGEVKLVFKKPQTIVFLIAVLLVGILTGLQWSYTFWFLEDLGATQFLMGLVLTVQCFLGEVPFMYFSGWIILKIGHYLTLALALGAFGVRYIGYYFLWDPWWVLPIELLQGFSFGTFYACMTSFAKASAAPGTEGTMQGIFGATFTGLGVAIGSLTGGLSFDNFGGRLTFLNYGVVSLVASAMMVVVHMFLAKKREKQEAHFLNTM